MWTRVLGALLVALSGFLRTLWNAARQLFHEVTGALFLVFAVAGGVATWREWRRGSAAWLVGLVAAFALMMAGFALSAFRRARRLGEANRRE